MNGIKLIITFEIKPESRAPFATLLDQVRLQLPTVPGCRGVRVFAHSTDPSIFTLLEEWDCETTHKAHVATLVASGAWDALAAHLSREPVAHYYTEPVLLAV